MDLRGSPVAIRFSSSCRPSSSCRSKNINENNSIRDGSRRNDRIEDGRHVGSLESIVFVIVTASCSATSAKVVEIMDGIKDLRRRDAVNSEIERPFRDNDDFHRRGLSKR